MSHPKTEKILVGIKHDRLKRTSNLARETVNDITIVNTYSKSFDFLADEPDIYSAEDLKTK